MNTIPRNIQNPLNNRPLTFCYDNFTTWLVPNHLTYGHKTNNDNTDDDNTNYDENRGYQYVQHLIDMFWKQ